MQFNKEEVFLVTPFLLFLSRVLKTIHQKIVSLLELVMIYSERLTQKGGKIKPGFSRPSADDLERAKLLGDLKEAARNYEPLWNVPLCWFFQRRKAELPELYKKITSPALEDLARWVNWREASGEKPVELSLYRVNLRYLKHIRGCKSCLIWLISHSH